MRKLALGLFLSALFVLLISPFVSAQDYKYVGAKRCAMCHRGEKKGKIFEIWQGSTHAKAFETLGTPEAKEVAKKAGVDGDPQKADACLSCHITGHGKPAAAFMSSYKAEEGVTCESCHGAGSEYQKMSNMQDQAKFLAAGGIVPKPEDCKTCHNEKSPTYKPFDYATFYKQIEHHTPAE